jgi:hypothetical protein
MMAAAVPHVAVPLIKTDPFTASTGARGHVLLWKCQSERAAPLRELAARVHSGRGRRKIAVVAAARHLLKIAYYVLRDGTSYDPTLLRLPRLEAASQPAA